MSNWNEFDPETPEDREARDQVFAEIAKAEKVALDAFSTIRDAVEQSDDRILRAGTDALAHLVHMATVQHNVVCRKVAARTYQRRASRAGQ